MSTRDMEDAQELYNHTKGEEDEAWLLGMIIHRMWKQELQPTIFKEKHLCGGINLSRLSTLRRSGSHGRNLKDISNRNTYKRNIMTRICKSYLSSRLEA